MKKQEYMKFNRKLAIILSAILGATVFLVLYGPYTLDVTNDAWIIHQFDGTDTMQHYAGWTQFRISNWNYPLGFANTLAFGDGTYITYTDSIPYVAILCKLFRGILPTRFQFFGWFTLGCFILQGVAAGMLLLRKFHSYFKILVGDLFFLTAPVFIERNFKHTALSAHWLILFSLYYYLEYRKKDKDEKLPWQLILLATLTMGIHPYFLPMVMIFVLLVVIDAIIKKHSIIKSGIYTVLSVAFPYAAGCVIGALGTDVINTRSGFGYFGMNLNALFNPNSASGFTWSKILQQRPQIYSTYEGFNYIGLGMLLMMVICAVLMVCEVIKDHTYVKKIGRVLVKNIPFILCMLFMTLFAVTNNFTWDDKLLFSIPFSDKLVETASIFRSSGRMFWPAYYALMLSVIYYLFHAMTERLALIVFCVLAFLQVYDMRGMFIERHERLMELQGQATILDDENLMNVSNKKVLTIIGTDNFEIERVLCIWAANHGMGVSYSVANTGKYENAKGYTRMLEEGMWYSDMRDDVVYVTFDEDVVQMWREMLVDQEYIEYKRGFYYMLYKE